MFLNLTFRNNSPLSFFMTVSSTFFSSGVNTLDNKFNSFLSFLKSQNIKFLEFNADVAEVNAFLPKQPFVCKALSGFKNKSEDTQIFDWLDYNKSIVFKNLLSLSGNQKNISKYCLLETVRRTTSKINAINSVFTAERSSVEIQYNLELLTSPSLISGKKLNNPLFLVYSTKINAVLNKATLLYENIDGFLDALAAFSGSSTKLYKTKQLVDCHRALCFVQKILQGGVNWGDIFIKILLQCVYTELVTTVPEDIAVESFICEDVNKRHNVWRSYVRTGSSVYGLLSQLSKALDHWFRTSLKQQIYSLSYSLTLELADKVNFNTSSMYTLFSTIVTHSGMFEEALHYEQVNSTKSCNFFLIKKDVWEIMRRGGKRSRFRLPMVCQPSDWLVKSTSKGESQLLEGGFLFSAVYGDKGVSVKNKKGAILDSDIKPTTVKILNVLQKQSLMIDGQMLKFVLDNFDESLKNYLMGIESLSSSSVIADLFEDQGLNLVEHVYNSKRLSGLNELNKFLFIKKQQHLDVIIITINDAVSDFFYLIALACEYYNRNKPFYMVYFLDTRFRCYAFGRLLSVQGSALAKNLIIPTPKPSDLDPLSFQNLLAVKSVKEKILSRQFGKYYFSYQNLRLNNNILKYISVDVCSSGSQIYSAINGDLDGLLFTNFIKEGLGNQGKLDYYAFVLEKFLEQIGDIGPSKLEELRKRIVTEDFHADHIMSFMALFDRSLAKQWIMCYFYSQGPNARVKVLYDLCKKKNIFFYVSPIPLREMLLFFQKEFINVITKLFRGHSLLLKFYKRLISGFRAKTTTVENSAGGSSYGLIQEYKGYRLEADEILGSTLIQHFVLEEKRVSLLNGTNTRIQTTLYKGSDDFDSGSASIAIAANATHNKDAAVCLSTLMQCFLHDITVIPSHDAFVGRVQDVNFIQKSYYRAFCAILLETDTLFQVLYNNCNPQNKQLLFDICQGTKISLIEYKKLTGGKTGMPRYDMIKLMFDSRSLRKKILLGIYEKKYLMSDWILS